MNESNDNTNLEGVSTPPAVSPMCHEVDEHIAALLDGGAEFDGGAGSDAQTEPDAQTELDARTGRVSDGVAKNLGERLTEHLLECDRCRDLRFEMEQVVRVARDAGADFALPADFEERVLGHADAACAVGSAGAVGAVGAVDVKEKPPQPTEVVSSTEVASPTDVASTEVASPTVATQPVATTGTSATTGATETRAASAKSADATDTEATSGEGAAGPSLGSVVWWKGVIKPRQRTPLFASLAAAVLVLLVWVGGRSTKDERPVVLDDSSDALPWAGSVERVARGFGSGDGLLACRGDASSSTGCEPLAPGSAIEPGVTLKTDGLTRARLMLEDDTVVVLDRASTFTLERGQARRGRLVSGDAIFDVRKRMADMVVVDVQGGRVEVLGTKFSLHVDERESRVEVSRGEVRLVDEDDRDVAVFAGQSGRVRSGSAPNVDAVASLGESFAWGDRVFQTERAEEGPRGLGELRARKPGEEMERKGAVTLTKHSVKVRIQETMARTEVEEVFTNHTDEQLEGILRFPLPPDAQIERLALEVDGVWEEGAFVDRERAAGIWRGAIVNSSKRPQPVRDEIVWVPGPWRDPALLEWQSGGRFELRVFPIPKRGERRVRLAYTQKLTPSLGTVRYTYPLPHDPSGTTRISDFDVDVSVGGQQGALRTRGYAFERREDDLDSSNRARYSLQSRDFVPAGDITLEYDLADAGREVTAWAYRSPSGEASPYVAIALRPELPSRSARKERAYVFVVDRSRSMFGEHFDRARQVVERSIRELDRDALVSVLDCDSECSRFASEFRPANEELANDVGRYLSAVQPEGASDLMASLQAAFALRRDVEGRELHVVYLGDGSPTVGEVQPGFLRESVERHLPKETRVSAVTVGSESDVAALSAVTRAGGGVVIEFLPGKSVGEAAYALLGASYGGALSDVRVTLPDGLTDMAPDEIGTLVAGDEVVIVARMDGERLDGALRLQGQLGDEPFERSYELDLTASTSDGNAFVPRLFAATQIADLEHRSSAEARTRAVELSGRFNVASRHTSLLVLESPAMFKAFGLNNERTAPLWTGEEDSESSEAGELATVGSGDPFSKDTAHLDDTSESVSDLSGSSSGRGSLGGARKPNFAPPPKSAPAPSRPEKKRDAARRDERGPSDSWPGAAEDELPFERDRVVEPVPPREPPLPPGRGLVPMRKVWDRVGTIAAGNEPPKGGSFEELSERRARFAQNPLSREALKALYAATMLAGDVERASELAERWSEKDPMDPDALTARADVAAQRGDRDLAIRILGSVVDVRPSDHQAQFRLARLYRWAGAPKRGCRHSFAAAQLRPSDEQLLSRAVRCLRDSGESSIATALLGAASEEARRNAERRLQTSKDDDAGLSGDLRLEARWDGDATDVDLVIVHPNGYRVSWLGAPTRSVISATDVLSRGREGLALRGAQAGEYAIEVVRADRGTGGVVRGEVKIRAGTTDRTVPFTLEGERTRIGTVKISMRSRLVPL